MKNTSAAYSYMRYPNLS